MTGPIDTAYVDILPDFSNFVRILRRDLGRVLVTLEREANSAFSSIEDTATDAGRTIAITITVGAQRAEAAIDDLADSASRDFDRIGRDARDAGRSISASLSSTAAGGLIETLSKIGLAAGGLGSTLGPLLIAGILAAIPVIIAVSAALADLIGLVAVLPAGLAVAAAAIAPLVISFMNFGEAIKAIQDGDPEKIAEALAKLAPAAASVAREFQKLLPQFQNLQRTVQQQFFLPLQGSLTNVVNALLPSLRVGLGTVAKAFGELGASFAQLLSAPDTIQVINEVFASTGRIVATIGPPLIKLFDAIFASVHEGLPFVERIAGAFGRALDSFANFLNKSIESGEFDAFMEEALATVKELIGLGKSVGSLLSTIFAGTDEGGRDFIGTLTDVITRLDEFFKSAEGQRELENMILVVKAVGAAIGFAVNAFIELVVYLQKVEDGVNAVISGFQDAVTSIGDFFTGVGDFLSSIPGKIGEFLSSLPGVIAGAFQAAFDQALFIVGLAIGSILFLVTEFPGRVVSFLSTLPEKIGTALSELGPKLIQVFDTALTAAKDFLVLKFQEIKDFIFGVPGEVTSNIGPKFLEAGRNLIVSFMQGFRNVGTFIGDVAGDIVGAVKGFLNRAIDKINSGIATIDNILPGDLPRIPRLAAGGIVQHRPGGILANIGEGGEDEVVAPLSKFERMMSGAGTVVNIMAGAVQVMFEGVVPTPAEAFTTGQAAGDGFADALARRDIRMLARAA